MLFAALLAITCSTVHADAPAGGTPLLSDAVDAWQPVRDTVTLEPLTPQVDEVTSPGVRMRASNSTIGADPARASTPIAEPIRKGDVLLLTIWLRAAPGEQAVIGFGPAHHAAAPRETWNWLATSADWQRIDIPFTADRPYATDEAAITLWLGNATGALDIGTARLLDYAASVEMIDLIASVCRGRFTVNVIDANGQPVSDANVQLRQTHDAFGMPVDPQHPPYEGLPAGKGSYGVPNMIAFKPIEGRGVEITDLPANAKAMTLLPNTKRNPGRFPFSGIPTRLRGLRAVTVDRGDQNVPGSGYSVTVDRPVEAYLFVQRLGEPKLHSSWRPTAMQATWGTTDWQCVDRIFIQQFDAGPIEVPAHMGTDEPWWTRVDGTSDAAGTFAADGYKGGYRITVRVGGKPQTAEVRLDGEAQTVTVRLP